MVREGAGEPPKITLEPWPERSADCSGSHLLGVTAMLPALTGRA